MNKIKPVIQKDIKDCGVSTMQWIFIYYGGYVSLEKLREDTSTNNLGTNAYQIVNTFQKWNFDSYGLYTEDINNKELRFPLIAHLRMPNGLEHFVVVREIVKNTIYLMDPSIGYKKMTIEEFNKLFTGNVIIAIPRSKIVKMDKGISISEIFINILKCEKSLVLKIVVTSLIWTVLSIISSYYLKVGSNSLSNSNLLKYVISAFLVFTILKVLMLHFRSCYQNSLNTVVDSYLYPDFLHHLFSLSLKNIKSRTVGEIVSRVDEVGNIKSLFTDIFISLFLDTLMFLISLIILYFISKTLFLILFIFIIIYGIVGYLFSKIMYKKILKNIDYHTDFNSILIENVNMLESIKHLNILSHILKKIEYSLSKYLLSTHYLTELFNISILFKNIILELCVFLINSVGFYGVLKGSLSIIDLFTFNILLAYCIDPVKNVIDLLPKYNYVKVSFSKISEFINIEVEKLDNEEYELDGAIVFKNVSFSYNNYDYILKNINLTIHPHTHILLDGPSGCGKSTICKLLYQSIDNYKGVITIGDKNLLDIGLSTIRKNILYISQDENLFFGTIKENIMAYRNIELDKFDKICNICEIDKIVAKKPLRYDSLIDPSTDNLSGGERQRIILARGLCKDANIIILDEVLSEVDIELETSIIGNIRTYFKDKTIIYISHKRGIGGFENVVRVGESNGLL